MAQLAPYIIQRYFDANGVPLAGGSLTTYLAGTTTPLATYTDQSGVTPNTNPIVLDSSGGASVWLGTSAYKFLLKDSLGNQIALVDNISAIQPGSVTKDKLGANVAGVALLQNTTTNVGALDVQVDNSSIGVNGSNELYILPGGVTPSMLSPAAATEVVFKNNRDFSAAGAIQAIPQWPWTVPQLLSNPVTVPAGSAVVSKWSPSGEFLAVGNNSTSPFIVIYQRNGDALTALTTPASPPGGQVFDLDWSPCGDFLAVICKVSPYLIIYQRFGINFIQLSNPASLPAFVTFAPSFGSLRFSPNGDFLALAMSNGHQNNFILYQRTQNNLAATAIGGTLVESITGSIADMGAQGVSYVQATLNASITQGNVNTKQFQNNVNALQTFANQLNAITTWTDITTASTLPVSVFAGGAFAWSPDSSLLSCVSLVDGSVAVYLRSNTTFSSITGPNVSSYLGDILATSFSNDGNYFSVALNVTPYILNFSVTANVFALLSTPAALPAGAATSVKWSLNNKFLAIGLSVTPYVAIYSVSNSVFSKMINPVNLTTDAVNGLDWHPTTKYLAMAVNSSPFIAVYKTNSTLGSNSLLYVAALTDV